MNEDDAGCTVDTPPHVPITAPNESVSRAAFEHDDTLPQIVATVPIAVPAIG
jgi:hypothetical protein